MANEEPHRRYPGPGLADWEGRLAAVIARKFERVEAEELEAELIRTVLELKARATSGVQDWGKYLAKALHNKAQNWTRAQRDRARREIALPEPDRETSPFLSANDTEPESQVALAELRRQLAPKLQELWDLLQEPGSNAANIARRLRKHRNTVRLWIRQIRQGLTAHGFQPLGYAGKAPLRMAKSARREFAVFSRRILQALARSHLSGTQWRVILWVLRETSRHKKSTTPFCWSGIAKELFLDRSSTRRAGRRLLRAKVLFLRDGRIGLEKDIRRRPDENLIVRRRSSSMSVVKKQRFLEKSRRRNPDCAV